MKNDDNDVCPICINEFLIKQCVNILPCGHVYHNDCLVDYKKNTCP